MASSVYHTELEAGTKGFHRTLRTRLRGGGEEWDEMVAGCSTVGLVYEFPGTVIVDADELRMREREGRLSEPPVRTASGLLVWADRDIEAPATTPHREAVLFRPLLPPWQSLSLLLPFHLRYLPPIQSPTDSPHTLVRINPPLLLKVCNHSDPSSPPFPSHLNPNTLRLLTHSLPLPPGQTLQLLPTTNQPPLLLSIPVGIQQDELWVQIISAAAVWIVFAWICSCLFSKHPLPNKKNL